MSYESRILSLSPVLYIPFTETSGTTFADSTGNGHDGTVIHSVTAGGGDSFLCGEKACLLLHVGLGYPTNIRIASPSTIPISDHAFSYEFWKTNQTPWTRISLGNNTDNIFGGAVVPPAEGFQNLGSDVSMEISVAQHASLSPTYQIWFEDSDFNSSTSSGVASSDATDNWNCFHYYCVTFDGISNIQFYKDGVPFGSGSATPISFTPVYCIIGQFGFVGGDSLINHLAVYDYALTSIEVADNYAAAVPRCDNLCFGLRFPRHSQVYLKQS